jgi:hypothetical protein
MTIKKIPRNDSKKLRALTVTKMTSTVLSNNHYLCSKQTNNRILYFAQKLSALSWKTQGNINKTQR